MKTVGIISLGLIGGSILKALKGKYNLIGITQNDETLGFVKTLLNDMNLPKDNDSHVRGALIIDRSTDSFCTELTCWGRMGYDLLKEMCQLYIKAHDHE